MKGQWVYPCDPECPVYNDFCRNLYDDSMTAYSGCGSEIVGDFQKRHISKCKQCQEYGAANVDVEYFC
jgi:hypothetical protein